MPAYNPRPMANAILDAIQQSGYSAVLASGLQEHPRKFIVTAPDGRTISLWVYTWTLTFGGRRNLPDEFRIQMTTVDSPLLMNPDGYTILIGYEPNLKMFAGFDLSRHHKFKRGSPSVQIDLTTIRDALQHGLTFCRKSNDEIAIGIRPDELMGYALNAEHLHEYGSQEKTLELLAKASSLQVTPQEIDALAKKRQRVVREVSRLSRDANFSKQVLNAYENRCAVTRVQLRLLDSAHIVPVGVPESIDHVTNGLALSPTYHRAYDHGLIYLNDSYEMRINQARVNELAALNLDGGIEGFTAPLGRILPPQDDRQKPQLQFIRRANSLRMIPR